MSSSPAPSLRPNAPMTHPSFDRGHETPAEQFDEYDGTGSMSDTDPRSVTPSQAQDQDQDELELERSPEVDAQPDARPNEPTPSNAIQCPICSVMFGRMQERDRHLESYLPHSILCAFQGCNWTGRRQWDFKEHWRRKHPEAGQAPRENENEIYDPKDFVKSIVDGTPVEQVARSAFAEVQESLRRRGKPDVGANVLGRNRDLRKWIRIPSSQVN